MRVALYTIMGQILNHFRGGPGPPGLPPLAVPLSRAVAGKLHDAM